MTKPEKFLTASGQELIDACLKKVGGSIVFAGQVAEFVRDEVAREVREECAAERRQVLQPQADAWLAVCNLMDSIRPQWHGHKMSGQECMLAELRQIAEEAARAEAAERERDEARRKFAQEVVGTETLRQQLADAKRQGAWEACVYLFDQFALRDAVDKNVALAVVESAQRGKYAPAAPAGVPLGEYNVTHDGTAYIASHKGVMRHKSRTLYGLLFGVSLTPTEHEYAALLRLADKGDGNA